MAHEDLEGLAQATEASCLAITQRWLVAHRYAVEAKAYVGPTLVDVERKIQGGSYHGTWQLLLGMGLVVPHGYVRDELADRTRSGVKSYILGMAIREVPVATIVPVRAEQFHSGAEDRLFDIREDYHSIVVVAADATGVSLRYPRLGENGTPKRITWQAFLDRWDSAAHGNGREAIAIIQIPPVPAKP